MIYAKMLVNVSLSSRGNLISILGNPKNIIITKNTLSKLYERAKLVNIIEEQDVEAIIKFMNDHDKNGKKQSNNYKNYFIKTPKGTIFPRSKGQANLIKQISEKQLVFAIGPAGTGKTFLAVSHAVSFLVSGMVDRIIISRPAVEAGEKLGFLPGDFKQKVDPYLKPIYDSLHENLPNENRFLMVEQTINNNFAGAGIAKFVSGNAWNAASKETKKEYIKHFKRHLALNIASLMQGYSNQKYSLINSKYDEKNKVSMIVMEIYSDANIIQVTWRVKKSKDRYFVIDLLVADISLVVTKRSEFNSMLKNVDYNLAAFNKKLASQNEISYQKLIK